ncbi:unnamed protein product, partial [Didymodactylos carnosus]
SVLDETKNKHIDIILYADDITIITSSTKAKINTRRIKSYLKNLVVILEKMNLGFQVDKTEMIHIQSNTKNKSLTNSMTLNGYTIVPSRKVKYLGLIIDEFLTFKPHIQQTAKNGTRYLAYLKNILQKNGMLNANMMLQLYRIMIIPRTDLSACVWANVTKAALKPLMKLQKLTLATALGTSRQTVALSSLEVFCNLLPVYFRLMRRQMIKAITLHSRLLYHPLSALFEKPEKGTIFAKLKEIISTVSSDNNPMSELIKHSEMHVLFEPCATAVDVIISNDELALNEEQELLEKIDNTTMLLIYTDASKQHDEVAAAVTIMTKAGDEFRWEDYG